MPQNAEGAIAGHYRARLAIRSQAEIAASWGVSRARVEQIEQTALAKLRRHPVMRRLAKEYGIEIQE